MKIAFLFSGQGAQYPGMGKDLYENYTESREIFDQASKVLDWDVKEVCFEDSKGIINQTRYTQSALFTTTMAAYEVLKAQGVTAEAVIGFSLGEYSALVASGILSFEEALRLVEKRACYMEDAAQSRNGGMAAVIGLEASAIEAVCEQVSKEGFIVTLANDNCPGQVVISGEQSAIDQAALRLKEAGAKRIMPLRVSGAFHSPLMDEAATKLSSELDQFEFKQVAVPIVSNVTATYMQADEARENIPLQIVNGVRFRESIMKLLDEGFDTFIEIGVKKTLCGFVNKISKDAKTLNVEDTESLKKVLEELGGETC
ncbi:MAG: ACP S-malonyltransferase [Cellulosilyticaceae bacterium]